MAPECLSPHFDQLPKKGDCRSSVVGSARSWIGTPYHHAADVRGQGVDCAMLLVRVFCDLGLVEPFDPRPYTKDWFLHRDEERYMGQLLVRAGTVSNPGLGDVMLFRIGRCFAHGGIVTNVEPLRIVHAFAPARCVVEDELRRCAELMARPHRFFSYWALDNRQIATSRDVASRPTSEGKFNDDRPQVTRS
jgi:hypothetical protein